MMSVFLYVFSSPIRYLFRVVLSLCLYTALYFVCLPFVRSFVIYFALYIFMCVVYACCSFGLYFVR